jgi:hypothetical protein
MPMQSRVGYDRAREVEKTSWRGASASMVDVLDGLALHSNAQPQTSPAGPRRLFFRVGAEAIVVNSCKLKGSGIVPGWWGPRCLVGLLQVRTHHVSG